MIFFGTDGIRGRVGKPPMTPDVVLKFGWAFGKSLKADSSNQRVLIGKDTRASGYMFESVLEAGLVSAGVNVGLLGPLPTPAIAFLVSELNALGGISISASHNPHHDNGVKFFSPKGDKLPHKQEVEIEALLEHDLQMVDASRLGKAMRIADATERYLQFCVESFTQKTKLPLDGMRLLVDCAHGATYHLAPDIYEALGAKVDAIGVKPDGFNINKDVGTMAPDAMVSATASGKYDCGIAFDGDGDRLLMADAHGRLIDGDDLLFLIAKYKHQNDSLHGGVVGTQMSNVGLQEALEENGIPFERTEVGDRHVLQRLQEKSWQLGGEPSGHILNLDKTNSCDAIINSLIVLQIVNESGKSYAQLLEQMNKYSQTLVNVPLVKTYESENRTFEDVVRLARDELGDKARIIIRPSGTEPLLRVMVEAKSQSDSHKWANRIADTARTLFS